MKQGGGIRIINGAGEEDARSRRLRRLRWVLILLLIVVLPWLVPGFDPVGNLVVPPVQWLTGKYMALAAAFAGG